MSFFTELKRRNVFRVAIAYGITAWLMAQIAGLAAASFFAPDWVMKMIITVLLLGFPVAMVMAWAYELTPEGLRREADVAEGESTAAAAAGKLDRSIMVLLVLAVAYFSYDKFVLDPRRDATMLETARSLGDDARPAPGDNAGNSIAVLPFVNMSADPEQEYFSDGLSEELLNLLNQVADLKVIARTSSFAFKGRDTDVREIGATLGVSTVLEGSVRRSGDRLRITAQLVNTKDGSQIWSETYERTLTDIFQLQDDVASSIMDALQMHVGDAPSRGSPTRNFEAYSLFLKARNAFNSMDMAGALSMLDRATDLDPGFAEAYEMKAVAYWMYGGVGEEELVTQQMVQENTSKALALNPDLIFSHVFKQFSELGADYQLVLTEQTIAALAEHPDHPFLLEGISWGLVEQGYVKESLEFARRYANVDPLNFSAISYLAGVQYSLGNSPEAVGLIDVDLLADLGPGIQSMLMLGILISEERDEDAARAFNAWLPPGIDLAAFNFSDLVSFARDPVSGSEAIDDYIARLIAAISDQEQFLWRQSLKFLYLYFGHLDRYYQLIYADSPTDATWDNSANYLWIGAIFRRSGFTGHEHYVDVARRLGIVRVWEKRGPPDFCQKSDGAWSCH